MSAPTQPARRTPLYASHQALGAKLVDFHGWELPVQYSGILKEHQAVREACGIFDVSHMGQVEIEGPQALELVQKVQSNDAARFSPGQAFYAHILNERGGVVDDVIVSRLGPARFFFVVNAATAAKDAAWLREAARGLDAAVLDRSAEFGMVALQGPAAEKAMACLLPAAAKLKRFGALEASLYGATTVITRTGYTGEDGFELTVLQGALSRVWESLLAAGASFGLLPCGLGARDTLRLEAGYLLYGSDVDEDRTPFEAGYDWVVKLAKDSFTGKAALEEQKKRGLSRRLAGVRLSDRGVPRPGAPVFLGGTKAAELSSGTFSPTLKTGIGMAYLPPSAVVGTAVEIELHGRRAAAQVCPLPFYRRG